MSLLRCATGGPIVHTARGGVGYGNARKGMARCHVLIEEGRNCKRYARESIGGTPVCRTHAGMMRSGVGLSSLEVW